MQLVKKGGVEGVWFPFLDEAKPIPTPEARPKSKPGEEPVACFKIRRIPAPLRTEVTIRHLGRKADIRRKNGEVISGLDLVGEPQVNIELARYACLDTFEAEVPSELVPMLNGQPGESVRLDGKLTSEVKEALFGELRGLAAWIVGRADSLTAHAQEEETELGKTS